MTPRAATEPHKILTRTTTLPKNQSTSDQFAKSYRNVKTSETISICLKHDFSFPTQTLGIHITYIESGIKRYGNFFLVSKVISIISKQIFNGFEVSMQILNYDWRGLNTFDCFIIERI